jgi:hypothetical protein
MTSGATTLTVTPASPTSAPTAAPTSAPTAATTSAPTPTAAPTITPSPLHSLQAVEAAQPSAPLPTRNYYEDLDLPMTSGTFVDSPTFFSHALLCLCWYRYLRTAIQAARRRVRWWVRNR